MNIEYFQDHAELCASGAAIVLAEIRRKPDLLLGAATGRSPLGLYEKLAAESARENDLFRALRVVKLDEWADVPENSEGACEAYLRTHLLNPLGLPDSRFISFASQAPDLVRECARIQSLLDETGPMDVCVLGLGKNGHLGFNEPGPMLNPLCHVATLSEPSRQHGMMEHREEKPSHGLTLGLKDILAAKRIILIVSGEDKEAATHTLLSGQITTQCPATFLQLHQRVDCLILEQRAQRPRNVIA